MCRGSSTVGEILSVRLLEESAGMFALAMRIKVLDREQPVQKPPRRGSRVLVDMTTTPACTMIAPRGSVEQQSMITSLALARIIHVPHFVQVTAMRANKNVARVAPVLCQQVTRKQIHLLTTFFTVQDLYPEKILYWDISVAIVWAICKIEVADLPF